jgi:hypothetical protein
VFFFFFLHYFDGVVVEKIRNVFFFLHYFDGVVVEKFQETERKQYKSLLTLFYNPLTLTGPFVHVCSTDFALATLARELATCGAILARGDEG